MTPASGTFLGAWTGVSPPTAVPLLLGTHETHVWAASTPPLSTKVYILLVSPTPSSSSSQPSLVMASP